MVPGDIIVAGGDGVAAVPQDLAEEAADLGVRGLRRANYTYTEDENGNPVYSWAIIDDILDATIECGCVPLVEIGFMPLALTTAPSDVPYDHTAAGLHEVLPQAQLGGPAPPARPTRTAVTSCVRSWPTAPV